MVSFPMVHHLEYTDAGPFAEPGAHNRASFLWGRCLTSRCWDSKWTTISIQSFGGPEGWSSYSVLSALSIGPPPQAQYVYSKRLLTKP